MADPTPLPRTQKRAQETKRRLFGAALKLFLKHGFDATTVSQITEAADVGKGTFFTHFSTKEAVLGEIGGFVTQTLEATTQRPAFKKLSAARKLLHIFDTMAKWHEGNSELSKLISQIVLSVPAALEADRPHQLRLIGDLKELVIEGQHNGEFSKSIDPTLAASTLAGVYFFNLISWHTLLRSTNLRKQMKESQEIVIRGLQK